MPTTRRFRQRDRATPDDALQRNHLLDGSCNLAGAPPRGCYCGLTLPDGSEDETGIAAARRRLGLPADGGDADADD